MTALRAPFPYFGGKRAIADDVWQRFGRPKQYIEPFCGSAAILLAAPNPCSLEVIGDGSGFIANFWRAVRHQAMAVAEWADYPVSHIDLGARHGWLLGQRAALAEALPDPNWPGDAKVAGWWLWGQCAWIGSGWCDWDGNARDGLGQIPHVGNAGLGVQAIGKIPHVSDAGRGVQAIGQIPHVSNAGRGFVPLTSSGRTAIKWLGKLSARLERVRVIHGDWSRTLNHHYGGGDTAVFFDPPYDGFEGVYGNGTDGLQAIVDWCREHEHLRIALCGHGGDYDLPGWDAVQWSRDSTSYGSVKTKDAECVWYSPGCLSAAQKGLFAEATA